MVQPIHEILEIFRKCFSHLWGFIIFGKSDLWASMSCLTPTQFSFVRMYYYCNNQSIKSLIQYPIIYWITSLVFNLFILLYILLVHTCENYLSSKINLICLFFASRLYFYMVSELQFIHGIIAQSCSSSIELRSYMFSLSERVQSHIPLWRRACY